MDGYVHGEIRERDGACDYIKHSYYKDVVREPPTLVMG